jgi:hypothetical protein
MPARTHTSPASAGWRGQLLAPTSLGHVRIGGGPARLLRGRGRVCRGVCGVGRRRPFPRAVRLLPVGSAAWAGAPRIRVLRLPRLVPPPVAVVVAARMVAAWVAALVAARVRPRAWAPPGGVGIRAARQVARRLALAPAAAPRLLRPLPRLAPVLAAPRGPTPLPVPLPAGWGAPRSVPPPLRAAAPTLRRVSVGVIMTNA